MEKCIDTLGSVMNLEVKVGGSGNGIVHDVNGRDD